MQAIKSSNGESRSVRHLKVLIMDYPHLRTSPEILAVLTEFGDYAKDRDTSLKN